MKILKNNIILLILILVSFSGRAQDGLGNYLVTAAENNPGLKARFSEYMAALEKVPQAGALPDPTLAFGYFIRPVETRLGPQRARLSASQLFPWFGTLDAKEDAATEMARAKYELFEEAKSRLFYDVKSTWYNLYFTSRAIAITRENTELLSTFQKLTLVKIESGKASAVDELRVEMEILDLENQLQLLLDTYQTQKVAFNNLLNVDESREVLIPELLQTTEIDLNREAILDSIRINNHLVLNLEFQRASYEYQQTVAQKMGKPNFTVGMETIFIGESSNPALGPGESGRDAMVLPVVGISIPLYRKKYTSMVRETVFLQEAKQHQQLEKINILETIYEKANTDYKDSERRIVLHDRQLRLAEKALKILETEYATNGKNFEEILRMERQVLMHSLELEKSRSDLDASVAFIQYLMGK